ncbi:hypothetical protein HG531_012526 [Fusarium graminearum]|nr:hypothetical protein HG531_012526 [Fusarium graminearum]
MEDVHTSIVIRQSEMVYQVISPNNIQPCNAAQVARSEYLLHLDILLGQMRSSRVKVSCHKALQRPVTPTEMASARETVREAAEAHHQKQTGGQIYRVVEHLVFVVVRRCEFLSQFLLDVMAQHPALEFVNTVNHITMRSQSHVSPSIVESPDAFFVVVCPKGLQVNVHAVEALGLVLRGPVLAGYRCFCEATRPVQLRETASAIGG